MISTRHASIIFLLCIFLATLIAGCTDKQPTPKQDPAFPATVQPASSSTSAENTFPPNALIDFEDANFGVHFGHTPNLSTTYNPHGGADRVLLSYHGEQLGGLLIRPAPPTANLKLFIESGKAYYKEQHGATTIDYDLYENPNKYKFHHLRTEVKRKNEEFVLERFVHIKEDKNPPANMPEEILRSLSGAFSFEFIYLKKDVQQLKPEIKTVIDTFKLEKVPSISGAPNSTPPLK